MIVISVSACTAADAWRIKKEINNKKCTVGILLAWSGSTCALKGNQLQISTKFLWLIALSFDILIGVLPSRMTPPPVRRIPPLKMAASHKMQPAIKCNQLTVHFVCTGYALPLKGEEKFWNTLLWFFFFFFSFAEGVYTLDLLYVIAFTVTRRQVS